MAAIAVTVIAVTGKINGMRAENSRAKTGRKAINIDEEKLC